jgi:hypothetical protein
VLINRGDQTPKKGDAVRMRAGYIYRTRAAAGIAFGWRTSGFGSVSGGGWLGFGCVRRRVGWRLQCVLGLICFVLCARLEIHVPTDASAFDAKDTTQLTRSRRRAPRSAVTSGVVSGGRSV